MKKYLIRGGADPFRQYRPRELLKKDALGGNSGNLMFLYGTMNVLTTSATECVSTHYQKSWTEEEIEDINQNYAALILPLADAFRADFMPTLRAYTNLIRQLKIPVVVNGVGLRAAYEPQLETPRPFDADVKAFVKEVLNHSSMLGLRGAITGEYLSKLGFIPERDYTIIGCPSLYTYGSLEANKSTGSGSIAVSLNGLVPPNLKDFYVNLLEKHPNTHLIQQRRVELLDLYYNRKKDLSTNVAEFANRNIFQSFDYSELKAEDRVHFFTSVPSWIEYMKRFDLFVGSRFHGTVAAILAGVPALLTPFDARTREFADYHQIPTIADKELGRELQESELVQLAANSDFYRAHQRNLEHYKAFLKANNLYSIFDERSDLSYGNSPMEAAHLKNWQPYFISAYERCSSIQKLMRKAEYIETLLPVAAPHILKRVFHR